MTRGRFVVFEGGEGAGKSTQVATLAERLRGMGRTVQVTREPGGTPFGAELRRLLLDPAATIDEWAEVLLYAADRAQHVAAVIAPALAAGHDVLCDRFVWSSLAYQGGGRGFGVAAVADANRRATAGVTPDMTVVLDLEPRLGLARARQVTGVGGDRIESLDDDFHATVRRTFLTLADEAGAGAAVIDASQPTDAVADAVWAAVAQVWA